MKMRSGFISNSSSSSFIILGEPATDEAKAYLDTLHDKAEIKNPETKAEIKVHINKELDPRYYSAPKSEIIDENQTMILTRYISDSGDEYGILGKDKNIYYYYDGGHGGPYDEDAFDEIADDVWLRKEHNYENKKRIRIK